MDDIGDLGDFNPASKKKKKKKKEIVLDDETANNDIGGLLSYVSYFYENTPKNLVHIKCLAFHPRYTMRRAFLSYLLMLLMLLL